MDLNHNGIDDAGEERDIFFQPSTGLDCSEGEFFILDAVTGERLQMFDAEPNGLGGTIWTVPALSKDGDTVYLTTGDCVQKPQAGAMAESLVALDSHDITRPPKWFHQRRLIDTQDFDIGNAPTVVDVPDGQGGYQCRRVVSIDKDGCIYGFNQAADIPGPTDQGFDPLRIGQQRVLWRTCFVPGSLGGGFNASGASFHYDQAANKGYVFALSHASFGQAPNDDSTAFAVDACNGDYLWRTSDIDTGWGEGAIASGMLFQTAERGRELQVLAADGGQNQLPNLLASVQLPSGATPGGGGVAIVDGSIYVPATNGVIIVSVAPNSGAALPVIRHGTNAFNGPYPVPLSAAPPALWQPIDPTSPYLDLMKP